MNPVIIVIVVTVIHKGWSTALSMWWKYEGFAGPDRWGEFWSMCRDGKQQSPININPEELLYDPNLKHLEINPEHNINVNGILENTENDITFRLDDIAEQQMNITQGPLSYVYRITELKLHYGSEDSIGSEHHIGGRSFPAELQIMGYNADLYRNFTEAMSGNKGLAIISVLIDIGDEINRAFDVFKRKFNSISQLRSQTKIHAFSIKGLLPPVETNYITYEGSLTQPGCQETATWIIYNKPVYFAQQQLLDLRAIVNQNWFHSNARRTMPLNQRVVRTNINFRKKSRLCTMEREMRYQVNSLFQK
ncbi:hypothetical protein ScPMuIL_010326 [Solemya velum]